MGKNREKEGKPAKKSLVAIIDRKIAIYDRMFGTRHIGIVGAELKCAGYALGGRVIRCHCYASGRARVGVI